MPFPEFEGTAKACVRHVKLTKTKKRLRNMVDGVYEVLKQSVKQQAAAEKLS